MKKESKFSATSALEILSKHKRSRLICPNGIVSTIRIEAREFLSRYVLMLPLTAKVTFIDRLNQNH